MEIQGKELIRIILSYLHRSKVLDPFAKREQLAFGSLVQGLSSVHLDPEVSGQGPCVEVLACLWSEELP